MKLSWKVVEKAPESFFSEFPEVPNIVLQSLYVRGLKTQESIDHYLQPDYSRDILDPYLFRDMKKAVDRIYQAIENKEKITIYGDYDADGVSGSTILFKIISELGGTVDVFLPHREKDGYGLNVENVEKFAQDKTAVLITCDCGISNRLEIARARELGIDTIITDHHQLPDILPEAFAIIHPRVEGETYPFKELAGGGVAFKFAQALLRDQRCGLTGVEREAKEKWLLDLVALSSVADMVSITGENRALTKYGLLVLRKNMRPGFRAILDIVKLAPEKIDARAIGFQIAPRINAAGRIGHADLSFRLLNAVEPEDAAQLARELNDVNSERQRQTEIVVREAREQTQDTAQSAMFFYKESWPLGLTGLVAGRLVKEYRKVVFVMSSDGQKIVGSGRSSDNVNILEAIRSAKNYLIAHGGHMQACGFRLAPEHLEQFKKDVSAHLDGQTAADHDSEFVADGYSTFEDVNWETVEFLQRFEPYGIGNDIPLYIFKDVEIVRALRVGKTMDHWKLTLAQSGKKLPAIGFSMGNVELRPQQRVDIVSEITVNQWNGNKEIQLIIRDIDV